MTSTQSLIEEANAARLQKQFSDACITLAGWLRRYDGVIPAGQCLGHEEVFKASSAMVSSVQAIHRAIADSYGDADIDSMYRGVCRAMHTQVQEVLSTSYGHNISLGMFHDNIWLLAKSFLHPLDMSKVEPDMATQRRMTLVDTIVAQAKPARPASRPAPRKSAPVSDKAQRDLSYRDATPQFS